MLRPLLPDYFDDVLLFTLSPRRISQRTPLVQKVSCSAKVTLFSLRMSSKVSSRSHIWETTSNDREAKDRSRQGVESTTILVLSGNGTARRPQYRPSPPSQHEKLAAHSSSHQISPRYPNNFTPCLLYGISTSKSVHYESWQSVSRVGS